MTIRRSARSLEPSVELHIEELVLHGFTPADRDPIRQAIQTELGRLFVEQGLPRTLTRDSERSHMDAGGFQLAAHPKADTIGRQIARTLYDGFQPTTGAPLQTGSGGTSP
jgi:hypothetical protein